MSNITGLGAATTIVEPAPAAPVADTATTLNGWADLVRNAADTLERTAKTPGIAVTERIAAKAVLNRTLLGANAALDMGMTDLQGPALEAVRTLLQTMLAAQDAVVVDASIPPDKGSVEALCVLRKQFHDLTGLAMGLNYYTERVRENASAYTFLEERLRAEHPELADSVAASSMRAQQIGNAEANASAYCHQTSAILADLDHLIAMASMTPAQRLASALVRSGNLDAAFKAAFPPELRDNKPIVYRDCDVLPNDQLAVTVARKRSDVSFEGVTITIKPSGEVVGFTTPAQLRSYLHAEQGRREITTAVFGQSNTNWWTSSIEPRTDGTFAVELILMSADAEPSYRAAIVNRLGKLVPSDQQPEMAIQRVREAANAKGYVAFLWNAAGGQESRRAPFVRSSERRDDGTFMLRLCVVPLMGNIIERTIVVDEKCNPILK